MIGNLLVKVARNEPLTASEEEELRKYGDSSALSASTVSGWMAGGNPGYPKFDYFQAEKSSFITPPMDIDIFSFESFDVPNNAYTDVVMYRTEKALSFIRWEDVDYPERFYCRRDDTIIRFTAVVIWPAALGAAEYRGRIAVEDDGLYRGLSVKQIDGVTSDDIPVIYHTVFKMDSYDDWFTFQIYQNSGDTVSLDFTIDEALVVIERLTE